MSKQKDTIFLHGMWRCGSTYIWSRFRAIDGCYAYYEPLHHGLVKLTEDRVQRDSQAKRDKMNHPQLSEGYFAEFAPLIKGRGRGVQGLNKKFAYDDFALNKGATFPALARYLHLLIGYAESLGRVPVLGLNRSVLRIGWMKENFGGFHLYIDRDPREIWWSYETHRRNGGDAFFTAWLRIVERNRSHPLFKNLAHDLGLNKPFWAKGKPYYTRVLKSLSAEQTYQMVFTLWLAGLLHGLSNSDMCFDMSLLTRTDYASDMEGKIEAACGVRPDFSEARHNHLSEDGLNALDFDALEEAALAAFPLSELSDFIDVAKITERLVEIDVRKAELIKKLLN